MGKLRLAAAAVAVAGGLATTSTPASAIEVCDPVIQGVCVYVLDARTQCRPGYQTFVIPRVPNPVTGGSVLLVCFLS